MTAKPEFAPSQKSARAIETGKTVLLYGGRQAPLKLNVVIVGCGLGGLAAAFALRKVGHDVTVLEAAPAIGEVGAGIQVTPNLTRILISWGLQPQLDATAVIPEAVVFRRYKNGDKVGYTRWGKRMADEHGAPYCHLHRADFHRMLHDLAVGAGVNIRLGCTVDQVNPEAPSVVLKCGEIVKADLLIGADGVKSTIREAIVGRKDSPVATGDAAYRATIPVSKLREDPDLAPFAETPVMTGWMGPGRHVIGYCIRGKEEYNMVLVHPDDGSVESWTAEGSADKMRQDFEGWEPRVEKLLSLVPSTLKWKLMDRGPLDTWIHSGGKTVLLGDACHPMLPYRAQGAAMAVEDAVVLGSLLSRIEHLNQLSALLQGYEQLRYARCTATQASARLNQKIFHLDDGPEQEARDASMREAMEQEVEGVEAEAAGNANQWADRKKNMEQFGYDAEAEAERWWTRGGEEEVQGRCRKSPL